MVKAWDWQEATATGKDNDGDEHESKVNYAVVSDDQAGYEVPTLSGITRVQAGDVLVQNPGDNSGRYDVLSADAWKNSGYGGGNGTQDETGNADREDSGDTARVSRSGGTDQTSRGSASGRR